MHEARPNCHQQKCSNVLQQGYDVNLVRRTAPCPIDMEHELIH